MSCYLFVTIPYTCFVVAITISIYILASPSECHPASTTYQRYVCDWANNKTVVRDDDYILTEIEDKIVRNTSVYCWLDSFSGNDLTYIEPSSYSSWQIYNVCNTRETYRVSIAWWLWLVAGTCLLTTIAVIGTVHDHIRRVERDTLREITDSHRRQLVCLWNAGTKKSAGEHVDYSTADTSIEEKPIVYTSQPTVRNYLNPPNHAC